MFHVIGNQGYYTPQSAKTRVSRGLHSNHEDSPNSSHNRSTRSSRSTRSHRNHYAGSTSYHTRSTGHRTKSSRSQRSHSSNDNNSSRHSRSCHARPQSARISGTPNDSALFSPGRTRTRLNWNHQDNQSSLTPGSTKRLVSPRKSRTRLGTTGLLAQLKASPLLTSEPDEPVSSPRTTTMYDLSRHKQGPKKLPEAPLSPSSPTSGDAHKLGQQQRDQLQNQLFRPSSKKNKKTSLRGVRHHQSAEGGQPSPPKTSLGLREHLRGTETTRIHSKTCDTSTNKTSSTTAADESIATVDNKVDLDESMSSMALELERQSYKIHKSLNNKKSHDSIVQHSMEESDELHGSDEDMNGSLVGFKPKKEDLVERTTTMIQMKNNKTTNSALTSGVRSPRGNTAASRSQLKLQKTSETRKPAEKNSMDSFLSPAAKSERQRRRGVELLQDSMNSSRLSIDMSSEQPQPMQQYDQQREQARRRGGIRTMPLGQETQQTTTDLVVDAQFISSSGRRGALLESSMSNLVAAAVSEASDDEQASTGDHRHDNAKTIYSEKVDRRGIALAAARASTSERRGALTQDSVSMLDLEDSTELDRRGALLGGSVASLAASAAALVHEEEQNSRASTPRSSISSADTGAGASMANAQYRRRMSDDSLSLGALLEDEEIEDFVAMKADPVIKSRPPQSAKRSSSSSSSHDRRGALLGQSTSAIVASAVSEVNNEELQQKDAPDSSMDDRRCNVDRSRTEDRFEEVKSISFENAGCHVTLSRSKHMGKLGSSRRGGLVLSPKAKSTCQNIASLSSSEVSDRRGALLSASASSMIAVAAAQAQDDTIRS